MTKNHKQQARKRKPQEKVVGELAVKYSVSTRFVQMVISGDANNENILRDYLFYKQGENKLLKQVISLVPFCN